MSLLDHAVAAAALSALLAGASAHARCGGAVMEPQAAQAAVDFVEARVKSAHVGSSNGLPVAATAQFDAARKLAARGPRQSELAAALNRALVPLGDAHLELRLQDAAAAQCGTLPLTLAWNEAGLWVRSGNDQLPTGARVVSIGGLTEDVLQQRLAQVVPHETLQWLRDRGSRLLGREDTLTEFGLRGRDGRVTLRVETVDGSRRKVSPELAPSQQKVRPWFGYRLYPESATGVFWFERFDYEEPLVRAFAEFLGKASAARVMRIAIDIRGNPGGDSSVAVAMLDALTSGDYAGFSVDVRPSQELAAAMPMLMPEAISPFLQQAGLPAIPAGAISYELPPPLVLAQLRGRTAALPVESRLDGARIFLLTDGGTFSSGTLFAALVHDNRLGTIVGEAPGNTASFNGSELRFDLSGTDYYLNLSSARLGRPDRQAPGASSIQPDIVVVATGADFAAGRDPVVDALLQRQP